MGETKQMDEFDRWNLMTRDGEELTMTYTFGLKRMDGYQDHTNALNLGNAGGKNLLF